MPMIRAMAQIEQDISDLEQEVVAIAQELSETYDEYLLVLGDSVQRQLILASYHLCTQGYPDQFLKLTPEQRRSLQQSLQRIGRQAREHLNRPPRLAEITQPFTSDLDGIEDSNYEDDATLKKLTAIVQRVMGENSKQKDKSQAESGEDSFELEMDADDEDDGDRFDSHLETLVIPDELDDDFLGEGQLTISEFSFDQLAQDEDEDETDWDEDDNDDWEQIDSIESSEEFEEDDEAESGDDVIHPSSSQDVSDADQAATTPGDSVATPAESESSLTPHAAESSEDDSARQDSSTAAFHHDDLKQTSAIPPAPLPDGIVGGSSTTVPPTLDLGIVDETPTISPPPPVPVPPTPKALARRCDRLEAQIAATTKQVSSKANMLLQKSGVLPKNLPRSVLDTAMKADLSTDVPDTPPNLLNLLVETGRKGKQPKLMRVMAVRLRLSELEFHSPTLMAWRSRIRELAAQLHKLDKDYKTLQRELAIAEAEAAWRSTWSELED